MPGTPSCFAKLVPANAEAKYAFNTVAVAIEADSADEKISHASRFVVFEPFRNVTAQDIEDRLEAESSINESESPASSYDATSSEPEKSESEGGNTPAALSLKYQGYYAFSFDVRPEIALLGWFIGAGRWGGLKPRQNGGVDILLCHPNTTSSAYEVAGRHARLFFDKSGGLILQVVSIRHPLVTLGNEDFTHGQRLISMTRSRISFGRLSYFLEFVVEDESEYQRKLRTFFINHLQFSTPPPDLSASPSPWDMQLGDWLLRGTVGRGAFATVSAAKHRITGHTAAAKFLIRDAKSHLEISEEVELLKSLPRHPHILQFLDIQYERGENWFTGVKDEEDERHTFQTRPERVVIIYTPFARGTFAEIMVNAPRQRQLTAFRQLLQGIAALHEAGFIHRDLKLANIGVVEFSEDSIKVVILDYGQTICATTCKPQPGAVGTIPYLAPEMELSIYDNSVDIWACGIVGLQLFITHGKLLWSNVRNFKAVYKSQMSPLQQRPSTTIENLLAQMLVWEPAMRISAEEALEHTCYDRLLPNSPDSNKQSGQKRARLPSHEEDGPNTLPL